MWLDRIKSGTEPAEDQSEWVKDDPTWQEQESYDPPEWLGDLLLCHWTGYSLKPWELDDAPLVWVSRMREIRYQLLKFDIELR